MWSNTQKSYSAVDSPWSLPDSVLSEELRKEVWCAISPMSHGIPRTRDEILASSLVSLRHLRNACLSYLEPRLADFRQSERFKHVSRKLLNLKLIPHPDPLLLPNKKNKKLNVDEALSGLVNNHANKQTSIVDSKEESDKDGSEEDHQNKKLTGKEKVDAVDSPSRSSSGEDNEEIHGYRSLPLGRRMLIYKPMPWTLKRPDKGNAVELSRKTGKKDHQKPKSGNIVGKEVWVTLTVGKNELGRHKSCNVVLHTDQRCSRVHGIVLCGVHNMPMRQTCLGSSLFEHS